MGSQCVKNSWWPSGLTYNLISRGSWIPGLQKGLEQTDEQTDSCNVIPWGFCFFHFEVRNPSYRVIWYYDFCWCVPKWECLGQAEIGPGLALVAKHDGARAQQHVPVRRRAALLVDIQGRPAGTNTSTISIIHSRICLQLRSRSLEFSIVDSCFGK